MNASPVLPDVSGSKLNQLVSPSSLQAVRNYHFLYHLVVVELGPDSPCRLPMLQPPPKDNLYNYYGCFK